MKRLHLTPVRAGVVVVGALVVLAAGLLLALGVDGITVALLTYVVLVSAVLVVQMYRIGRTVDPHAPAHGPDGLHRNGHGPAAPAAHG